MPINVGIPRALYYYRYFSFWNAFLMELGAEITVSEPTTQNIMNSGVKCCVDEACMPVKLYHGHVLNLADRVDYIFIPRFTSVSKKEYICPKFGGLPDMVRRNIKNLPPLIDVEINMVKHRRKSLEAAVKAGSYICSSRKKIKNSYVKALASYREHRCRLKGQACDEKKSRFRVLLLGHSYNIYDPGINMNMVSKLEKKGVEIMTLDMFDNRILRQNAGQLLKPMFWNYGTRAVGCIYEVIKSSNLDGIIYLMSFGCGIDSFVSNMAERRIRRSTDFPYMNLNIDEHTGEAGLDTRLEAFVDMLEWRKHLESNISSSG